MTEAPAHLGVSEIAPNTRTPNGRERILEDPMHTTLAILTAIAFTWFGACAPQGSIGFRAR